jgi:hypothetical protein
MAYNLEAPNTTFQALRGLNPVAVAPSQFQSSVPNLGAIMNVEPVAIRPLAGWSVPSNRPELMAQGVQQGISAIAQGITAAYQSKQARDETLRKEKREDRLLAEKYAREDKQLIEKYSREQAKEERKHGWDIDLAQVKEGIKNRMPSSSDLKQLSTRSLGSGETDSSQQQVEQEPVKMFGRDPDTQYLRNTPDIQKKDPELGDNTTEDQTKILSGLGDIFNPTQIKYYTAANTQSGAMADVPSAINQPPVNPASDALFTPDVINQVVNPARYAQDLEQGMALANLQEAIAKSQFKDSVPQPKASPEMEQAIGIDAIYNEQDALALRNYAKTKGIPAKLKATRGGYEVTWPSETEIEKYRENIAGGKQVSAMKPEEVFKEEDKLRSDYLSQAKNFQVVQSAWNNLKGKLKDPSGASDMSMIFSYMKLLDPTSTVREGEYANASNVGTIPQTLWGKYNKAIEGSGFLDPKVRESFVKEAKLMYQSALEQHQQSVDQFTEIAKSYGLDPKRVAINLVSKEEQSNINNTINQLAQELESRKDIGSQEYKEKYYKLKELRKQQLMAK